MIVLTGANSRTQRAVIKSLDFRREPLRAFERSLDEDWMREHGVSNCVPGDMLDSEALETRSQS